MEFNMETVTTVATALGTFIAGVIVCIKVCKQKIDQYMSNTGSNVSGKVRGQTNSDIEIIKKMEQVKELLNADRVQVYEFHNGEHYANGRSALKVSCTYEVYRAGVKPIQRELLSIPISCIPHFVSNLLDKGMVDVNDLEEIRETMPSTYSLKSSHSVQAYTDLVIRNEKNEPVGFIGVQWCNKEKKVHCDMELYRLAAYLEEKLLANIDKKAHKNKGR